MDLTFDMANTIAAATQHAALTEKITYAEAIDVMAWLIKNRPNEPVKNKFDVGVRVRFNNPLYGDRGVGTIMAPATNGDDWMVKWDNYGRSALYYYESDLVVTND